MIVVKYLFICIAIVAYSLLVAGFIIKSGTVYRINSKSQHSASFLSQ